MGRVAILVGIPSFNNGTTIGHVARICVEGLEKYFGGRPALLLNSDGGSTDQTKEAFFAPPVPDNMGRISTRYRGMAGKGTALKAIFEAAVLTEAQACVVVDSDLRSITPEWIGLLAEPIVEGTAGYVAPLYLRHKYDGTITNSIVYPLTRTLYGKRVRQPIGGDFGFSGELAARYLQQDVWQTAVARFGIDIFMTTTAINEGFRIRQANLGAKIHDAKDPALHLGPMFRQVVGTLFSLMRRYESRWMAREDRSEPVAAVGALKEQEPEPVPVSLDALLKRFREGAEEQEAYWSRFLSKGLMEEIRRLKTSDASSFSFPARVWVDCVYEFAVAYNKSGLIPDQIVDSLTPLYFGRTASFVRETESMDSKQAEEVIEGVAELFELEKPKLASLWSRT
ncbi:MAG: glycosyltransferase [Candidatus Abyssobacteria bacterium SURF_5]|uniref:Glycosyltransferase n=1 Tax=Abyssobacteria bacterium (strain SURF_5) TaxID=2093360 RepID=A0A3A4N2Q3_ABYX5|nr:MAG: glycosyltransferase [Candidatus Abyssubacteria bacterium SURF_5]